jgi:hypothetical protein
MELETTPVDMAWLAEIDAKYDAQFERAKRARDECSGRALREEFETPKATRNAKAGRGRGGIEGNLQRGTPAQCQNPSPLRREHESRL